MFNVEAGKSAYLESAYQWAELEYERRVAQSSNPVFGGTLATIKQIGNKIWRPIKVLGAYTFGIPSHPENVAPTSATLGEEIKDTTFAQNMEKSRDYQRRYSELKAEGVGELLSGNIGGAFRQWRAAKHQIIQETQVVMPDDSQNWVIAGAGSLVAAGVYVAARIAGRAAAESIISGSSEATQAIGELSAPSAGSSELIQTLVRRG